MRTEAIGTHLVKHIWEAYATKLLEGDTMLRGKCHNKIQNFYLYRLKMVKKAVYQKSTGDLMYYENVGFEKVPVLDYQKFRAVIESFLRKSKLAIINGEAVHINCCGKICGKRVERDFRKKKRKQIDWFKTRQQPMIWDEELGRMKYAKVIYFTSDDWCRIAWIKPGIVNETVYEFEPTHKNSEGTTGFKNEFSKAHKKDPLLKYKYLFSPIRNYSRIEVTD